MNSFTNGSTAADDPDFTGRIHTDSMASKEPGVSDKSSWLESEPWNRSSLASTDNSKSPAKDGPFSKGLTAMLIRQVQVEVQEMLQKQNSMPVHKVTMNLHPPSLGTLDVELKVRGNRVYAAFVTASVQVKEILETGMGDLRQSFSNAGMESGEPDVFLRQEYFQEGEKHQNHRSAGKAGSWADGGAGMTDPDGDSSKSEENWRSAHHSVYLWV